jgi:hypothetical protein
MGLLQRGFPAEIDAVSSPQVSPRWFEALGEQDRVLPFPELVSAELLFAAVGQEASSQDSATVTGIERFVYGVNGSFLAKSQA